MLSGFVSLHSMKYIKRVMSGRISWTRNETSFGKLDRKSLWYSVFL